MSISPNIIGTVVLKVTEPPSFTIQLISADKADSISGKAKLGSIANFDGEGNSKTIVNIDFDFDPETYGKPGAFLIKNTSKTEFFLVSLTLKYISNDLNINFDCTSWIYDGEKYPNGRLFFSNQTYLPKETPDLLIPYRESELQTLRGDGTGERQEWERIYDYDVYNDLGNPDLDDSLIRPVAGGSTDFPYPRRGRTGRPSTMTDPNSESPSDKAYYIPRDEIDVILPFGTSQPTNANELESGSFVLSALKFIACIIENIETAVSAEEFASFEDAIVNLYQKTNLSVPKVIQVNQTAWKTDEEFAREFIAGVNPNVIRVVQDVPQKIKQHSGFEVKTNFQTTINFVEQAIQSKKLFVIDYHDIVQPYLRKINSTSFSKTYASRTYLFLTDDGTLKPAVIELISLPAAEGAEVSEVYFPAAEGTEEGTLWQLAKAYAIVNDACFHQLISHWLHTHAVVEPFVIATNRQLSVVHPIYKLLHPHFRNTMNINAAARKLLINADGIIENTYSWARYAVEMSSILYKDWIFPEQALPADLIKRGVAVKDDNSPHGLRLVIKDYPYAVDGLDIWDAIETWVKDYVSLYYKSDEFVQEDSELQSWWKEVVEKGHGDKKDETWWPKMQTCDELIQACTIIIWITSALHAAVNFGQYPYGGLILNRPTLTRRLIPKKGTPEYKQLVNFPEQAYLKTIIQKSPFAIKNLTTLELLSKHLPDEFYLGQRESGENWTSDTRALNAFRKFGHNLRRIEDEIKRRNRDPLLKNRVGPVEMPYTLLYPSSGLGVTFQGIPNSISI